jgi:hypothetical protein
MTMIHSDRYSEKFRKYVIKIIYQKTIHYALWCTDLEDTEYDYLLLTPKKKIICATEISVLKEYVENTLTTYRDFSNIEQWLAKYKANRAYTSYDLDDTIFFTSLNGKPALDLSRRRGHALFSFYCLFSDYILQIGHRKYEKMLESPNQRYFFFYDAELGAADDSNEQLEKPENSYSDYQIKSEILEMIRYFGKKLELVD